MTKQDIALVLDEAAKKSLREFFVAYLDNALIEKDLQSLVNRTAAGIVKIEQARTAMHQVLSK